MKSKPFEVTLNLPMMNSTEIKYKKALRLCDRPVGKTWIAQLGSWRCTLQAIYQQA